MTLLVLGLAGAVVWYLARPVVRRVNEVCEHIDEDQEARARRERLEQEEEARARAKAEEELAGQFPKVPEIQEGDEPRIDETH